MKDIIDMRNHQLKNKEASLKKEAMYKDEEELLREYPNAEKVNDYQYTANKDGWTYWIYNDSVTGYWKLLGRTQDDPNVFKKLIDYLSSFVK